MIQLVKEGTTTTSPQCRCHSPGLRNPETCRLDGSPHSRDPGNLGRKVPFAFRSCARFSDFSRAHALAELRRGPEEIGSCRGFGGGPHRSAGGQRGGQPIGPWSWAPSCFFPSAPPKKPTWKGHPQKTQPHLAPEGCRPWLDFWPLAFQRYRSPRRRCSAAHTGVGMVG